MLAGLAVPDDLRARVHSPAGLDIGARTPLEIAVSVVAELVSVRAGRSAPEPAVRKLLPMVELAAAPTAIDPVCHMTVAAVPDTLHLEHDGTIWYFCAPGCRKAFAADPASYGG